MCYITLSISSRSYFLVIWAGPCHCFRSTASPLRDTHQLVGPFNQTIQSIDENWGVEATQVHVQ